MVVTLRHQGGVVLYNNGTSPKFRKNWISEFIVTPLNISNYTDPLSIEVNQTIHLF